MGAIRGPGGTIERILVIGILLQLIQNVKASTVPLGPAEMLISKIQPKLVKQSDLRRRRDYENAKVPDYLLRLRERHNREWMNFGQAERGNGPNLGIITSIRHHRNVETKRPRPDWQGQQNLNFQLAPYPKDEQLVASSLRLPIRTVKFRNSTLPVAVRIAGATEVVRGEVYVEEFTGSWLNVPLPPASLHNLLRNKRILQLKISLDDSRVIDTSAEPHILTFHRSIRQSHKKIRVRRDISEKAKIEEGTNENLVAEMVTQRANRKKGHRKRRKGSRVPGNREKRSPHYLMNKRYIDATCQRRDLTVNFNAIGWSRWVIAPAAYNAGYCFGYCPFPLSAHFNTTNHAIIIHLMHNLGVAPPQVGPPCCTPLTFSPQSILFFDGGDVVLQVYEDMIVESCGCR